MRVFNSIKEFFSKIHKNNKAKALKFILGVPLWIILIALFLIVFGFARNSIIYNRADNDLSKYWAQGSSVSYRHMIAYARGARASEGSPALYIDQDVSIRRADVANIRNQLQGIVDAGRNDKKNGGLDEDGSPKYWEDCYSTDFRDVVSIPLDENTPVAPTVDCSVVAVGGNFKVFHPFIYLSGGFLADNCVDMNQVVINDELAWRFFKSYDVIGNKITLMGETFNVAGVVRESDSSIDKTAGVREPRCYIYFQALENYYLPSFEGEDASDNVEIAITCYEAMLPEIVKGVAISDFKNAMPSYTETNPQLYIVSATGRLGLLKIWDYMMPIGEMGEKLSGYSFPYWEKVAQLKIQNVFFNVIFIIIGFVLLFVGIVMLALKLRKAVKQDNN